MDMDDVSCTECILKTIDFILKQSKLGSRHRALSINVLLLPFQERSVRILVINMDGRAHRLKLNTRSDGWF